VTNPFKAISIFKLLVMMWRLQEGKKC